MARGGQPDGKGLADWVWHMQSPPAKAPVNAPAVPDAMDVDMEDLVPNGAPNPRKRALPMTSQRCDVYGVPVR